MQDESVLYTWTEYESIYTCTVTLLLISTDSLARPKEGFYMLDTIVASNAMPFGLPLHLIH